MEQRNKRATNSERQSITQVLLKRYKADPKPELLNQLLAVNLGLIQSIVRKTCFCTAYFDDALQEAMLGFCKAAETYDLSRNTPFSVYCAFYIRSAIYKWLNSNAQSIRVPRASVSERRYLEARNEFYEKNRRLPTREELAEVLGVSLGVLELREYAQRVKNVLSFDGLDEVNLERIEIQTSYEERIEDSEEDPLTPEQRQVLDQLTEMEREILLERFYDGRLVRDIAESRGIPFAETRRIIRQALAKCRQYAQRIGLGDTGLSFIQELEQVRERRGRAKSMGKTA